MADEEVDFEEAVDLGDAPMEESAGSGKKGRDATGRRLAIHTLCLPWLHFYCGDAYRTMSTHGGWLLRHFMGSYERRTLTPHPRPSP